jgi:hypothetical protein
MRPTFFLVALLGLFCALAGLWFGGYRNEAEIAKILSDAHRPKEMPFFRSPDSFYWVSYAREMFDTGKVRVRFTYMDNAPYGRPNLAWASLNAWYLVVVGKVWSVAAGTPPHDALPAASTWASPILYLSALVVLLGIGWFTGNFPAAAAAVLVLGTAPRVYDDFAYAVPGHHGWHDLACFSTLLGLAAAIRKSRSRIWFVVPGLTGAIAIWIGATQQVFGFAAAGIGALMGMLLIRFRDRKNAVSATVDSALLPAAECWRLFGWSAGIVSLFFYLFEYAPRLFAMHLEVNHPVYSLAFIFGGEFLCRTQRLIFSAKPRCRSDIIIAAAAATGLATIASVFFFGPMEWHTMRQPFIQRLHREIAEFQPITRTNDFEWIVVLGAPMFLVATASARALGKRLKMADRMALLVCAFPCAVAIGLSFVQLRWAGIASASAAALAAVLFADHTNNRSTLREPNFTNDPCRQFVKVSMFQSVCICLPIVLIAVWYVRRNGDNAREIRDEILERCANSEVAGVLQAEAGKSPPVVLFCAQKIRQAWIGYATGIQSIGSLYWDDPFGIRDEAEFLATYDEETAHRIARARGITHVVTTPSGGSVIAYHYMWQGNKTAPQIRQTLAYRLAAPRPTPPSWLQQLPTGHGAMAREGVRIYRVL